MKRLFPLFQKINDFIFGYDFFISYAWKDGRTYAEKLKNQLTDLNYVCFLDSEDYVKGGDWKIAGKAGTKENRQASPCRYTGCHSVKTGPP